ncbi:MAG TPA: hypothetical protein VF988_05460 [Verrucomicrobiae bacterium]
MKTTFIPLLWLALLVPFTSSALIVSGVGHDPVPDPGWPQGSLVVANLPSRVGWWEGPPFGGGEWHFNYRGDTEALNQALTNFAAIVAPALDLVIHDGPMTNQFGGQGGDARIDWSFTVWVPEAWHYHYNDPHSVSNAVDPNLRKPAPAPRLDVYVGNGLIDWSKVKVPANVHLRDERASAVDTKSSRSTRDRLQP